MTVTVPDPMPRGAFKIEMRHVSEVSHAKMPKEHHDGEDVLEEDEFEACAMDQAEATQRMSSEENNKSAKLKTVGFCCVK